MNDVRTAKDPRANELHKALTKQYADKAKITVGSKNTGVQAKSSRIITPIHTAIMIMPTTAKWQKMMQWIAKHWRKSLSGFAGRHGNNQLIYSVWKKDLITQ
ncbi:MAG: hypothetical protein ACLRR3_04500 [Eubacterium sp.]